MGQKKNQKSLANFLKPTENSVRTKVLRVLKKLKNLPRGRQSMLSLLEEARAMRISYSLFAEDLVVRAHFRANFDNSVGRFIDVEIGQARFRCSGARERGRRALRRGHHCCFGIFAASTRAWLTKRIVSIAFGRGKQLAVSSNYRPIEFSRKIISRPWVAESSSIKLS